MKRTLPLLSCFLLASSAYSAAAGTRAEPASATPALAGLSLRQDESRVRVVEVLDDTPAREMGLKAGDVLLYLNGTPVASPDDAAAILGRWAPGTRLAAVALRGMEVLRLSSKAVRTERPQDRDAGNLSRREAVLRARALDAAKRGEVAAPQGAGFRIDAEEKIWIRFPAGIPAGVSTGQVLEGETSTAMTTDAKLDFLAVAQGSRVWAQVVSVSSDEEELVKLVRLHIFKIALKDGRTYGCSAIPVKVSGRQRLIQASPGGTLIAAVLEDEPLLASPELNFQIEFLYPWTIYEPSEYYRTGPGLWLKSGGDDRRRWFEVTHVIENRSADRAGIEAGDLIHRINGVPAQRLSFLEAVRGLYGETGSALTLDVQKPGERLTRKLALKRGAAFRRGTGIRARRRRGQIVVSLVRPGSPAEKAGLRQGDVLLKIGDLDLKDLGRETLARMISDDMTHEEALVYMRPGEGESRVEIRTDWYETELSFKAQDARARTAPTRIKASEPPTNAPHKQGGRSATSPRKRP